jgi:hypothetical protein
MHCKLPEVLANYSAYKPFKSRFLPKKAVFANDVRWAKT